MKCLIVVAHPLSDSLCRYLGDHIAARLKDLGHEVVEEDLYEAGFDPVLTNQERASYYSGAYDASGVSEQVLHLKEADALVLVYPTWWFSFPAILKGWFDRVWGPGVAYDHADDLGPIKPRLEGLRKVLVVTTLGAPWWVDRLVMWQPVKRVVKYALLGACARNNRLSYLSLYKSENADEIQVKGFVRRIEGVLNTWGRNGF